MVTASSYYWNRGILQKTTGRKLGEVLDLIQDNEENNFEGLSRDELEVQLAEKHKNEKKRVTYQTICNYVNKGLAKNFIEMNYNYPPKFILSKKCKKDINFVDDLLNLNMNEIENLFTKATNDPSVQYAYKCKTDMRGVRRVAYFFAKHMNKSFHATNIYPPQYWMAGDLLFNWETLKNNRSACEDALKNFIHEKFGFNIGTITEWRGAGNKLKVISVTGSLFIELNDEDEFALFKVPGDDAKLVIRFSEENGWNIYSGIPSEKQCYMSYFDIVNGKNDGIKKVRFFIYGFPKSTSFTIDNAKDNTESIDKKMSQIIDEAAIIDEAHWKEELEIAEEFITEHNNNVSIYIYPLAEVCNLYISDVIIIDEKFVLLYEAPLEDNSQRGGKMGRLVLLSGEKYVNNYMKLFNTEKPPKTIYDFWGFCQNAKEWLAKGNEFNEEENFAKAIEAYDKAIELDPNYAQAWNNKGLALKDDGDIEMSNKAFARAKELGYPGLST